MKRLLLTGSTGFIGSYFFSKYKTKYKIKTFSFLRDDFYTLDVSDIDVVLHLSALVHQIGGGEKKEYERVNVIQTLELAKKAKKQGIKQFVFMSTVKVYGEETDGVYTEQSICNPKDEYGRSKLKAELELKKIVDKNFKLTIIRTPVVYGYGVKGNIRSLINLVNKMPVLPFANIKNRRSMVYVGNLCHLVDVVIEQNKPGVFLASDDESLSTTKIIQLIAKNLNKKIYLLKVPFFKRALKVIKPSFYKRLYESLEVDNTYTRESLGLVNSYSVDQGFKLMIKGEFF